MDAFYTNLWKLGVFILNIFRSLSQSFSKGGILEASDVFPIYIFSVENNLLYNYFTLGLTIIFSSCHWNCTKKIVCGIKSLDLSETYFFFAFLLELQHRYSGKYVILRVPEVQKSHTYKQKRNCSRQVDLMREIFHLGMFQYVPAKRTASYCFLKSSSLICCASTFALWFQPFESFKVVAC